MGRKSNKNTIEVSEGIFIKPITDNGIFHYHFTFDGKPFRKSTKTSDRHKATKIALEAFDHITNKKHTGLEIAPVTFKKLAQDYLATIKHESKHKYHSETIVRHFVPFFKDWDDVSKIKVTDLDKYGAYRLLKNPTVKPQTLNRENGVLNQLLQFGAARDFLKPNIKIKFLSEKQTRSRRSHFTLDEYHQLIKTSKKRISELRPNKFQGQSKGLAANKLYQRLLLHDIILLIANSGMRVDEVKGIRWRDIIWDANAITLPGTGKMKNQRKLNVRDSGLTALKRIKSRREKYLLDNELGNLNLSERIQTLATGIYVASFKKGFNQLLIESGFNYASPKDKHTLTSLRHFFATIRMTTKTEKRAGVQALAKQMGTSVKMIEQHYGHDTALDYSSEILG